MREKMFNVEIMSKINCPLCDDAVGLVEALQREFSFQLNVIDIYEDDALLEKYQLMIPVVLIDGEEVDSGQVDREKVKEYFLVQTNKRKG